MIDNPAYFEDDKLYLQKDIAYVGIDIWQVNMSAASLNVLLWIITLFWYLIFKCSFLISFILQVKAGSIFDNILVTDDEDFARQVAKETFEVSAKGEKEKKEAKDEASP